MNNIMPNRTIYFDVLRIISVIAVIMIHVSAMNMNTIDTHSYNWQFSNLYDSLASFAVPVFVMISGALLLDPNKRFSIKTFYSKNLLRVSSSLVFWSIVYSVFYKMYKKDPITIKSIIIDTINGHFHLWFLFMLIGLYIATPFFRLIAENLKLSKLLVLICLLFSFIIPNLNNLILFFPSYAPTIDSPIALVINWFSRISPPIISEYVGYFFAGYLLRISVINKRYTNILYLLGSLSAIYSIVVSSIVSMRDNASVVFYHNTEINMFFVSIAIFLMVKNNNDRIMKKSEVFLKIIVFISDHCFAIYLVHMIVLYLLEWMGLSSITFNSFISIPVITLIIFTASLGVAIIIKKIPFMNKYIT